MFRSEEMSQRTEAGEQSKSDKAGQGEGESKDRGEDEGDDGEVSKYLFE
jgi:hypothetical protein